MKKYITLACLASLVIMTIWKLGEPRRIEKEKQAALLATSDARVFKENIRIQGDEWVGYMVFKSKAFQNALAAHDIGATYEIEPDFKTRAENLHNGSVQIAAMTIDAWLLNGKSYDYPGVIGFVIDESTGGDVIIGGPKVKSINDLKKPGIKGTFVGYSPSEFLLKSSISHFRLEDLKSKIGSWRTNTIGESQMKFGTGEADFAVLWEPQATETLEEVKGSTRILDTAQARDIIIDVGIVGRKFLQDNPKTANLVVKAYFQALHQLLNNPEEMKSLAMAYAKTDRVTAEKMMAGLTFVSLETNQNEWFGSTATGSGKLFDGIQRISQILVSVGDFKEDPLDGNPHTITNRRLVGDLINDKDIPSLRFSVAQKAYVFRELNEVEWMEKSKDIVGTLVEEPILFIRGTTEIEEESEHLIKEAAEKLVHYPTHRVLIEAGVAPGNDPKDDEALSTERAEALKTWLIQKTGGQENRFHAFGLGSAKAPSRNPGESFKAWENRCRFAKIYLVKK